MGLFGIGGGKARAAEEAAMAAAHQSVVARRAANTEVATHVETASTALGEVDDLLRQIGSGTATEGLHTQARERIAASIAELDAAAGIKNADEPAIYAAGDARDAAARVQQEINALAPSPVQTKGWYADTAAVEAELEQAIESSKNFSALPDLGKILNARDISRQLAAGTADEGALARLRDQLSTIGESKFYGSTPTTHATNAIRATADLQPVGPGTTLQRADVAAARKEIEDAGPRFEKAISYKGSAQ